MQHKTKRTIAREVLILFSCILIIGLSWITILVSNRFNENKQENLQIKVDLLSREITNIKSDSYYKTSLISKFRGKVPVEIWTKSLAFYSEVLRPDILDHPKPNNSKPEWIRKVYNAYYEQDKKKYLEELQEEKLNDKIQLYNLLNVTNFSCYDSSKSIISNYQAFCNNINNENSLRKIYNYLIMKKYIDINFNEFVHIVNAEPYFHSQSSLLKYNDAIKRREEMYSEIDKTRSNIFLSTEIDKSIKLLSIYLLIAIYPLRAMALSVRWAFRTLKEKQF